MKFLYPFSCLLSYTALPQAPVLRLFCIVNALCHVAVLVVNLRDMPF